MKINTGEYDISNEVSKIINTNNLSSKKLSSVPEKNDVCEVIIHSQQFIPMDDLKSIKKLEDFVC